MDILYCISIYKFCFKSYTFSINHQNIHRLLTGFFKKLLMVWLSLNWKHKGLNWLKHCVTVLWNIMRWIPSNSRFKHKQTMWNLFRNTHVQYCKIFCFTNRLGEDSNSILLTCARFYYFSGFKSFQILQF